MPFVIFGQSEILIFTNHRNYSVADSAEQEKGVYKKGDIVTIKNNGSWGKREGLPSFVRIKVNNANKSDINTMIKNYFGGQVISQTWQRFIDWQVINSNLSIDGWRLSLYATNSGLNNKAGLTRARVENYINKWGGEVFSVSTNDVTFDISVFNAIKSNGFWGRNVSQIIFQEFGYEQSSGLHTIRADYSFYGFPDYVVREAVLDKEGIVLGLENNIIDFTITRQNVLDVFKQDLKENLEIAIFRRKYRISESDVDAIINAGGIVTRNINQLRGAILDRGSE